MTKENTTYIVGAKTLSKAKNWASEFNKTEKKNSRNFLDEKWKKSMMEKYNLSEYDPTFYSSSYRNIILGSGKLQAKGSDKNYYIFDTKTIEVKN